MNKIFTLLFCGACGLLALLPLACAGTPSTPITTSMGTVTATSGSTFSPASVTITHGSAVTFVLGGGTHTLYIDNGSGTCTQNYSTWPQTINFPSAGTFNFHCSLHTGCGTSCSSCTGMVGQVIVQ
ncbi:MAG TPA: hypothetical protein VIJ93_06480 [bacterium]